MLRFFLSLVACLTALFETSPVPAQEMKDAMNPENQFQRKNPRIAAALSLVIPGSGQFYNGQPIKGVTQLGTVIGGFGFMVSAIEDDCSYIFDSCAGGVDDPDPDDDNWKASLGAFLWLGGHLWSVIDAPISANRINRKGQHTNDGHLPKIGGDRVALGFHPVVQRNGLGVRLKAHF